VSSFGAFRFTGFHRLHGPSRLNRFSGLFTALFGGQIRSASPPADTTLFSEELYSGFR
jgi:hypothetical protein